MKIAIIREEDLEEILEAKKLKELDEAIEELVDMIYECCSETPEEEQEECTDNCVSFPEAMQALLDGKRIAQVGEDDCYFETRQHDKYPPYLCMVSKASGASIPVALDNFDIYCSQWQVLD